MFIIKTAKLNKLHCLKFDKQIKWKIYRDYFLKYIHYKVYLYKKFNVYLFILWIKKVADICSLSQLMGPANYHNINVCDPPYVPETILCAFYRLTVILDNNSKRQIQLFHFIDEKTVAQRNHSFAQSHTASSGQS